MVHGVLGGVLGARCTWCTWCISQHWDLLVQERHNGNVLSDHQPGAYRIFAGLAETSDRISAMAARKVLVQPAGVREPEHALSPLRRSARVIKNKKYYSQVRGFCTIGVLRVPGKQRSKRGPTGRAKGDRRRLSSR